MTKEEYDTPFFTELMLQEKDIEGMNGVKSRAYFDNQIKIDTVPYYERIDNMTKKELDEINNPEYTSCRNLFNAMKLSKDLYYLKNYSYDPFKDRFSNEIESKIIPCKTEDDTRYINYIKKRIYSGGSFKYLHQDKL